MSQFIQLHLLTSYPPSNLNRDDMGRPKTAVMGGSTRLRISSQSLKRAWRTSDTFTDVLGDGEIGTRTRRFGRKIYERFKTQGIDETKAIEWSKKIAGEFGDIEKEKESVDIRQLAHINTVEQQKALELADLCASESREPTKEELDELRQRSKAVDIALFGRMLAAAPDHNIEAASQVAHAITVHKSVVESDYFTAVDDLNTGEEDLGAGHIGETGYGAGLFYTYICINRSQLIDNLLGDEALADRSITALAKAAATVSPKGKQNSYGSRAFASYVLAEKGEQQPRSLVAAFLRPVQGENQADTAIKKLEAQAAAFDNAYGVGANGRFAVIALPDNDERKSPLDNVTVGSLDGLLSFVGSDQ